MKDTTIIYTLRRLAKDVIEAWSINPKTTGTIERMDKPLNKLRRYLEALDIVLEDE